MTELADRLSRHADLHEHQPWADDEQMQFARDLREAVGLIAELARLRAQEPEYWQWRRKRDPWEIGKTFNSQVYATTADSEVRCLYAAPPAQPAEPVQRLSDERAAFEAWHNEYRTQELVRRDDTYYNTHVRCRWEGWQARAIESALQPGWRDIETPQGWKLVPVEPSVEMRRAAAPWIANYHMMRATDKTNALTDAYQAMLKAAPLPPKATK